MVQGWEVGWGFTKQSPCCLLEGSPLSYLTSERDRIQFKIVSPVNRDSNRVQDRILKEPWGAQHNMFFTGSCLQCLLYTFPYTLCGRLFSVYALWLALFRIRFVAGSFRFIIFLQCISLSMFINKHFFLENTRVIYLYRGISRKYIEKEMQYLALLRA